MAREALTQKPNGNYVLLWGDKSDDNADLVKSGVMNNLQSKITNGNIKILYGNYIEAWSKENTEFDIDMIIRLSFISKIDAIIASCDEMTRGAINILKKYDVLKNTYIAGQNADQESLKLILKDEQTITISKSSKTVGYAFAELAVNILTNGKTKTNFEINGKTFNGYHDVLSILFDPVVINKFNLGDILISGGLVKKEDLYK